MHINVAYFKNQNTCMLLKVPTNATVSFRNSMSIQQYVCNDVCTLTIEVCAVRVSEYFHCLSLVPPPLLFHEETKGGGTARAKNPLPNRILFEESLRPIGFQFPLRQALFVFSKHLKNREEPDLQLNRHLSCSKAIETLHNIS